MFSSTTGRLRGLMATTLLATIPTALACESTATTADDTRTVEVRIENGETSVVVNGDAIPGDRIRTTDAGIVVLDEDGRPMPGIGVDTFPSEASGGIVVKGAEGNIFVVKREVMEIDGGDLQRTADEPPRAMLGIMMAPAPKGVEIVEVLPGTPAAAIGLRPGDVIMSHEDAVLTPGRLEEKLQGSRPGQVVTMRVLRDGREINPQVRLGEWDPSLMHDDEMQDDMQDDMQGMIRRLLDGDGEDMEVLIEMLMSSRDMDHEDHDHREHEGHDDRHHGHHEDHGHHGNHGDVEQILGVLSEHLPHLFHNAHVDIDVAGDGRHELEIHIEIRRDDHHDDHGHHEDHDEHHRDHDEHDDHGHHEDHDEHHRDHGDHGDHGHHEDHDEHHRDHGDHERWMHEAFEQIHHHVESMIGEVMEGMHEVHERMPMIERRMNRQLEEFAREWTREAEGFAREWQEETEGFARDLEGVMNERARQGEEFARRVGDALRRSEQRNRMLEERINRLESMLERMTRRQAPQADRPSGPDRPDRPSQPDRPRRRGDRKAPGNDA